MAARKQIGESVYQALVTSATLATLCGGSARVYKASDSTERTITSALPTYVSVWPILETKPFLDLDTFEFQISVWSLYDYIAQDVMDAIDAVVHRVSLTIAGWTNPVCRRRGVSVMYDDTAGVWRHAYRLQVQAF